MKFVSRIYLPKSSNGSPVYLGNQLDTISDLFFMTNDLIGFPSLNLPSADLRLRKQQQRTQIYDAFRKRWVVLTPEEWVRQHFLHYLHFQLKYPANLIAVEKSLTLNGLSKRADIVVFDRKLEPWMLVECKKVDVKLDQSVFDQAARYNLIMKVPYLLITNGMQLLAAEIKNEQVDFIQDLPDFPML